MNTIEITVPYSKKHLVTEIKSAGGKFSPEAKIWILPDNQENRSLKELVERRLAGPSQNERVKNIANLTVDLLNALKYRQYKVVDVGDRIVLESVAIIVPCTPPVATNTSLGIESKPLVIDNESLVIS